MATAPQANFIDPRNDLAFKKIFSAPGSEPALRSLLNAILELDGDRRIASLTIGNPYQPPLLKGLRDTALDVHVTDGRGVRYIVEMQVEREEALAKRVVYYSAKSYASQIKKAENYPRLNQVIFVGILNFSIFEGDDFLTRHLILNAKTKKQELKDLEFSFIELPKFRKSEQALASLLDDWVWYFKTATEATAIPERAAKDPGLRQAWEQANMQGWSQEEVRTYDFYAMRATNTQMREEKLLALQTEVQEALQQKEDERRQKEDAIQQKEDALQQKKDALQQKERLAAKLRELGIDPENL